MKTKYIAFLRGINVGGHHKVPMADLKKELHELGFENVVTLLNSGNIIFESDAEPIQKLEKQIATQLEEAFGFPIPTIIRKAETILELLNYNPFEDEILTKDIRFYVSFLQEVTEIDLQLPWSTDDKAFKIIHIKDKTICSILDLSISKTPKAMGALEKFYGKDITTRNWNTIKRMENK